MAHSDTKALRLFLILRELRWDGPAHLLRRVLYLQRTLLFSRALRFWRSSVFVTTTRSPQAEL